jgi:hypothetical protein
MKLVVIIMMIICFGIGTEHLFFAERVRARVLRGFDASPMASNVKRRAFILSDRWLFESRIVGVTTYLMGAFLLFFMWKGQWK